MDEQKFRLNRTPVLTFWAAVVAERLGFDCATALIIEPNADLSIRLTHYG